VSIAEIQRKNLFIAPKGSNIDYYLVPMQWRKIPPTFAVFKVSIGTGIESGPIHGFLKGF
jgi:hypothetical protein